MFEDKEFWYLILNTFIFSLLIYSTIHKLWETSKTTFIVILGFQVFAVLVQFVCVGFVVMYLISFTSFMYIRANLKPREKWSNYESI